MLYIIILNVIIPSVIILIVHLPSVIILNVIMPSVGVHQNKQKIFDLSSSKRIIYTFHFNIQINLS